jgi:hypothetical protein
MTQETALQTEFASLAERLEDRASVVLFAWSFGLGCAAFMGVGVAIKLFHDSLRTPKLAFLLLAVGLGCAVLAAVRLARGLRLYGTELADYRRFLAVRAQLGLDKPQLPQA